MELSRPNKERFSMPTLFGSDRVLLYDVDPWSRLGFGVPNFGNNIGSLSLPIANLVDEIGKIQLHVMTHVDALRDQPPSRNTVERLAKMCARIQSVLANRQQTDSQIRLEPGHATPAPEVFLIHPCPYFKSEVTVNRWLREYNQLCMVALTNMMQHSDNNLALTITEKFAKDIWQYFREIQLRLATELLLIERSAAEAPDFRITPALLDVYAPNTVTVNTESSDVGTPIFGLPTEDDLGPLRKGIPANMIIPNLRQYPIGPIPGLTGLSGSDQSYGIPGDTGTSGAGSGGTGPIIGPPTL